MNTTPAHENEFARLAEEQSSATIIGDFWGFLCASKKWWLLPVLVALGILGMLVLMSGSAAAPFIYTLF